MPNYEQFSFEVTHQDPSSKARVGLLKTPHGTIETPNFIFCATKGALKGVTTAQAREAGVDIILSNTYHMMLQPGSELVAKHGGLHRFLDWDGPMFTDSGGFQIFSLGHGGVANEIKSRRQMPGFKDRVNITEEGAYFKSYIDGKVHLLTPEISMQVQKNLGADLVVVLDECTPYHNDKVDTERSMLRSHRWALRSLQEFERIDDGSQALYGIVQGGIHKDLRKVSAEFVAEMPFFANAIGGSLGGSTEEMQSVVSLVSDYLVTERPTHLLGIGGFMDIWHGASMGMDTFDCTHPTRVARHGSALVHPNQGEGRGHLNMRNSAFKEDMNPIEEGCSCYCCKTFTRAYIHHLLKAGELLSGQLLTIHNISFMMRLARAVRESIKNGTFEQERRAWGA
ncbi:MAG TPA: tRNA guanosine(34) transglycosylase Tgt [Opitutae bacterium]|nr:tRNA guanosine(34) transglycosylase Tgt [Opitutae bacterium]